MRELDFFAGAPLLDLDGGDVIADPTFEQVRRAAAASMPGGESGRRAVTEGFPRLPTSSCPSEERAMYDATLAVNKAEAQRDFICRVLPASGGCATHRVLADRALAEWHAAVDDYLTCAFELDQA